MSQFQQILTSRQIARHGGQPLWKYALDDNEFHQLLDSLKSAVHLQEVAPVDCALYYAEWWKRCYNGGFPSKREIFNSIKNGQYFSEEAFYQHARKGGNLLGIRWIKNQNTLYFKTLLLQGGLPVRHISVNKGAYKNFLLKILEINPSVIDDFAFDSDVTSLLPESSRNPEIYECCLAIVKAIINDDDEYLSILAETQELKEISSELQIRKRSLKTSVRRTRAKIVWMLDPAAGRISLYLGFPEMPPEQFLNLFPGADTESPLEYEYKFYYNNLIVCKFIKKANGCYKTDWINQDDLIWDGTDNLPDLFLTAPDGKKIPCNDLVTYLPSLNKPTLWSAYDDQQYTLEKGSHTNRETGFVMCAEADVPAEELKFFERSFKWIEFTGTLVLGEHSFKSSSKKIEWLIVDERPGWIKRANFAIARRKPKVMAEDETGKAIQDMDLKWRQRPTEPWNNWSVPPPAGLTEVRIQVGDITEFDQFFNIGQLKANITSATLHQAEVELTNNPFQFRISENALVTIDKLDTHTIQLNLVSSAAIPGAIHGMLKMVHQPKSLQFEMAPPFHGVEVLDNQGNILPNNSSLTLNKLHGFRLMTNQADLVMNISNTAKKGIIISEPLDQGLSSLLKFGEKIDQLYALSDTMDSDAEIILEIAEKRLYGQVKLKEYRVKRYNQQIHYAFDEQLQLRLETQPVHADLYAVPLDCSLEDLYLRDLINHDSYYRFREETGPKKFITFCGKDSAAKIQPAFVCLNPENEETSPEDRIQRIIDLRDELLGADHQQEIWLRLLGYYRISLQNDLPYSTFDILRTAGFSSELAARIYVFLTYHDETTTFREEAHQKMERDLGFCFHWVNKDHWAAAMGWIGCMDDPTLLSVIFEAIKNHFDELQPTANFSQIAKYALQGARPRMEDGYHLNTKVNDMRSLLGSKVLDELPDKCPKVPDEYKSIIRVNEGNANVKILLKSPVAVALSIAGLDAALWYKENEAIRRNVKYSQQLNPEWYSGAINYCLTKI